jgi:hypothetical protein
MTRLIACGLAALTFALGAGAAVATTLYRWVDAQGVVHYSDTPQPGAAKVQVQDAQTYKSPPVPRGQTQSQSTTAAPVALSSYQCQIISPAPEQGFFDPEVIAIAVSVTPAPGGGDHVLVSVDGTPLPASPNLSYQITQPDRGAHTITATVQAADGRPACTAAPVTFNVQRTSLLSPQSAGHH